MNFPKEQAIILKERKPALLLLLSVLVLIALTLTQDYLEALVKNSGFYFSESFLFSSFSWLFAPIVYLQYLILIKYPSLHLFLQAILGILSILLHLFFYPIVVWVLSALFYDHTFSVQQTLNYALSQKFFLLVMIYSGIAILYNSRKLYQNTLRKKLKKSENYNSSIDIILVTDANKKLALDVSEVFFISANPPYINIHLEGRKYLHNETLKTISQLLPTAKFVRIHKSTIVNISKVMSYVSRGNGDYDLFLKNNISLRVSRNFAADFKSRFEKVHQVTSDSTRFGTN